VYQRERELERVCERERENYRERESVCVYVCVWKREEELKRERESIQKTNKCRWPVIVVSTYIQAAPANWAWWPSKGHNYVPFKHVCMYICMYVCMYVCMFICMYAVASFPLKNYIVCTYVRPQFLIRYKNPRVKNHLFSYEANLILFSL
jgi:hypothetical protein